jgi:hypothetical protein
MKAYGGVLLTSALVGGEWSPSRPGHFTPGERAPGTLWIGSWVGPRTGLDYAEMREFLTLPGLEPRPLCRPARSQSLHRLHYSGLNKGLVTLYVMSPKGKGPSADRQNILKCILTSKFAYYVTGTNRHREAPAGKVRRNVLTCPTPVVAG